MNKVLIFDCETTGVDRENDLVIELGAVLWSVTHRCILEVYSGLLHSEANAAEAINGIPGAALRAREVDGEVCDAIHRLAGEADAVCAHQADFDRAFASFASPNFKTLTWICTREDMAWPRAGTGTSLIATALAHGVAVTSAHRAVYDCLLLTRLFEVVPDIDQRLEAALAHARLPKVRLVSLAPYDDREIVKAAGFKWDPARREWWRVMAVEDAKDLPFGVREVAL